jgi:hypothetical protein
MERNPYCEIIFIDSCAFDPKCEPESNAAELIFTLHGLKKISIIVAHSNKKEIEHPNTPPSVKQSLLRKILTVDVGLTAEEELKRQEIWRLLTGNGRPAKMEQDAMHVFEAHKYGGFFVTTDARIIKLRDRLHKVCDACIVKPSELTALLEKHNGC